MDFEFEWNGDAVCDEMKEAAAEAVEEAAQLVLKDCKPPVRTGALADSGDVEVWPPASHGTVGASVVYGGRKAPHAHLVHELPDGHKLNNGEEKWLEKAADRKRDEVLRLYESKIAGVLNDG